MSCFMEKKKNCNVVLEKRNHCACHVRSHLCIPHTYNCYLLCVLYVLIMKILYKSYRYRVSVHCSVKADT